MLAIADRSRWTHSNLPTGGWWREVTPLRRGQEGWYITCPGCQREFESRGLRCCSTECERRLCERAENMALMAEVGMEPKAKPKCSVPGCDNPIPKWRNGRRVSQRARFCDRHSRHS
jgi:hypothetical protein